MELKQLPLDEIREPKTDLRSWISSEGLEELTASVKARGILQPLRVKKGRGRYEIQDGHRRYLAAKRANLVKVPCLVLETKEDASELDKITANLFREDISPLDLSKHLHLLHEKYGYSRDALADILGVGKSRINQLMVLTKAPPELQEALKDRRIGERAVRHLSQIENPRRRKYLLRYAIDGGATVKTIESWVRQEKSAAAEIPAPILEDTPERPPEEAGPIRMQCKCCNHMYDPNTMVALQLCLECQPVAVSVFKSIREAKEIEKGGKENGDTTTIQDDRLLYPNGE